MTRPDVDPQQRELRTKNRHGWPIRRTTLADEGRAELCAATSPEERIAMMAELAREAWQLAGRSWPTYERAHTPIRRTVLADA